MSGFARIFWAVLWRTLLVFLLNGIVTGLSTAIIGRGLPALTLRIALAYLPAALIFWALARAAQEGKSPLRERNAALSAAQWGWAYRAFALWAGVSVGVQSAAILLFPPDVWLALARWWPATLPALWVAVPLALARGWSGPGAREDRETP